MASPKDFLELIRPKQWPKNVFLLAALLFSGRLADPDSVGKALLGLLSFILLSSSVYAFNDAQDLESDRRHPTKKHRPVASGRVKPGTAMAYSGLLALAGLFVGADLGVRFLAAGAGYLAMSVAYSLALKHEVILDVFFVSAGFVIRAVAGGLAIAVPISPWLLSCTTLLALFLALSKRRAELELLKGKATSHRRALSEYSPALLDQMISVVASATLVAYMLYAFWAHAGTKGPWMMLTVPYVLYGIFRYYYLSHRKGMAGAPEQVLLTDRPTQVNLALWVLTAGVILMTTK